MMIQSINQSFNQSIKSWLSQKLTNKDWKSSKNIQTKAHNMKWCDYFNMLSMRGARTKEDPDAKLLTALGWPGWVDLAGWLRTETVVHTSINWARCRVTLQTEIGVPPLCQTLPSRAEWCNENVIFCQWHYRSLQYRKYTSIMTDGNKKNQQWTEPLKNPLTPSCFAPSTGWVTMPVTPWTTPFIQQH